MKVSCDEGIASHVGPESCGDDRKVILEALTGESAGRVLSLENVMSPGCRRRPVRRKPTAFDPTLQGSIAPRVVIDPAHAPKHLMRKPGDPGFGPGARRGPCREPKRERRR
jgi:hypothetical protein